MQDARMEPGVLADLHGERANQRFEELLLLFFLLGFRLLGSGGGRLGGFSLLLFLLGGRCLGKGAEGERGGDQGGQDLGHGITFRKF